MEIYNQLSHEQFAQEVANIVGVRLGAYREPQKEYWLTGLTSDNFVLIHKWSPRDLSWKLIIISNTGTNKDDALQEKFQNLPNCSDFEFTIPQKRVTYRFASKDEEDILLAASDLAEFVKNNDLGQGSVTEQKTGVSFSGTQFDRLKERGATMSGMFGHLVCQAADMNLLMTQAEYYISAGEIDGVELNQNGEIISIYECQSGIHRGAPLDRDHLHKALESYLYDPEVIPTVRKIVILAGEYDEYTFNILKERYKELSRRETPIELIVLKTDRQENVICVHKLNLG